MCIGSNLDQWIQLVHKLHFSPRKPRRTRVRVLCFTRRRKQRGEDIINGEDMKLKNLKLYMENISILQENEELRKKANLLHQENLALISQFQKIFS